uniref:Uncharacterized protein n=1 Tax=Salix viminalis TaxID=40686 RepID=A0A6N2L8Y0_SALVM
MARGIISTGFALATLGMENEAHFFPVDFNSGSTISSSSWQSVTSIFPDFNSAIPISASSWCSVNTILTEFNSASSTILASSFHPVNTISASFKSVSTFSS